MGSTMALSGGLLVVQRVPPRLAWLRRGTLHRRRSASRRRETLRLASDPCWACYVRRSPTAPWTA